MTALLTSLLSLIPPRDRRQAAVILETLLAEHRLRLSDTEVAIHAALAQALADASIARRVGPEDGSGVMDSGGYVPGRED